MSRLVQRARHRRGLAEGQCRRRHRRPAAIGRRPPRCRPATAASVLALRPAWASWMPGDRALAGDEAGDARPGLGLAVVPQMPVSAGEMRPSADTAVASAMTAPAPPTARLPRCTRCQSLGTPSIAEYWHIGATTMRLRRVCERCSKGSNNRAKTISPWMCCGFAGKWCVHGHEQPSPNDGLLHSNAVAPSAHAARDPAHAAHRPPRPARCAAVRGLQRRAGFQRPAAPAGDRARRARRCVRCTCTTACTRTPTHGRNTARGSAQR